MKSTKSKLTLLLCLSLVLSFILAACGSKNTDSAGSSGTSGGTNSTGGKKVFNTMETAEIPTMNTYMSQDAASYNVENQVFEGLMRLDQQNKPTLGMAAAEPTVNKDKTVYTFKLRDAKWSNGDPVTANDFVYAWRQAIDPKNASPYGAYMMSGVIKNATQINANKMTPDQLGVKAVDDKTLVVTLEHPINYFLSLMTFPLFDPIDQKYAEKEGKNYASNSDNLVYNGPFTLTKWNGTGDNWTYEKNPTYWDKDNVKVDEINVNVIKDPGAAVNLYQTGKLDWAQLSGEYAAQEKTDKDAKILPEPTVFYLKFNQLRNGKKTPLANKDIRQAIGTAFDKEAMAKTINADGSSAAYGLVPKGFIKDPVTGQDFRDENGKFMVFNAADAKKHWEAGLKAIGQKSVTLELLGGDTTLSKKLDAYLKSTLEQNLPGLHLTIKEPPFKVRLSLDNQENYDIEFAGWGPDYQDPYTFTDLFLTGGEQNKMGYSDPKYDKLVNDAYTKLATNPEAYWKNNLEAEKVLFDDAAIAPVYQRSLVVLQRPTIKGIVKNQFGPDYSYKWVTVGQ
ncbi:peptide ABC transporter substrate-binding protein [Heyndrickxia acidicola]|uniref:Peptide ABC transporter substrate-binding protein n=1 Tax=Heyndrickxia acidicola TaxID=209389 RepID=A0ABU6MCX4_9BACI|nr:peptide ABC transporter substrate-binding protein [Heyndrickxia acidicola]MED1202516.1 peptide ABC transporter substrate-binding protein [Heyndrickxia acidicola]